MARRTLIITYLATYLLAFGGIFRIVSGYYRSVEFPPIALCTGVYLVLLLAEPLIFRQSRIRSLIYLVAQTAAISGLAPIIANWDLWALLFFPLVAQAMVSFGTRTGLLITGIITAITGGLLLVAYNSPQGLSELPLYGSANFLVAAMVAISREAVAARDESEKQKAELEVAHSQLQQYTERAEELAVLQERNRLARELHDAVTQTLFSASLIAEALPALWERDPEVGRERLAMLRQMSRGALAEMRTLLLELRPAALVETGLEDLLRQLGEAVTGREGVPVTVDVDGSCKLSGDLHVALYRIAQEALNNVAKHARAGEIGVRLHCAHGAPALSSGEGAGPGMRVELVIHDDGRGFEIDDVRPDQMGLGIMRERAEAVGARLEIASQPGQGTTVTVVWPGDGG